MVPKVLVIAQQKGGAGKTTLARLLACAMPGPVGLLDTDPQGTLTGWWNRREAADPILYGWDRGVSLQDVVVAAGRDRARTLIIDTPPSVHAWVADIIAAADLVVIPVQPSIDDIEASVDTLGIVEDRHRPFCFVVTMATPGTRLAADTVALLAASGRVCPAVIHNRVAVRAAHNDGRTVVEVDPKSKAADEARGAADYVSALLDGGPRRKQPAKKTAKRVAR